MKNLTGLPDVGWIASGETWSYSAWNSTLKQATITVQTDATTKYSTDMLVRFAQSTGGTKYGRIVTVAATTLTVWMPGYTFNNEAITSPVYSVQATPYGVPSDLRNAVMYKFSVYLNNAANANAFVRLPFDAALFDTNSNVDLVTNKGRFTAPVTGYYHFDIGYEISGVSDATLNGNTIYKNGAEYQRGAFITTGGGGNQGLGMSVNMALTAGDYIEPYVYHPTSKALQFGSTPIMTWFTGNLLTKL